MNQHLWLCLLLVAATSTRAAATFTRSFLGNEADGVCADGTKYGYYTRKAANSSSSKWLIYMVGGDMCFSPATCEAFLFVSHASLPLNPPSLKIAGHWPRKTAPNNVHTYTPKNGTCMQIRPTKTVIFSLAPGLNQGLASPWQHFRGKSRLLRLSYIGTPILQVSKCFASQASACRCMWRCGSD